MLYKNKDDMHSVNASDLLITVDDELRKQIQNELLIMYLDILTVCKRNGITPFLIGGSALGTVRHGGFIPWDDDLDIGMSRKDYNIFKSFFQKELGETYILNAPNYSKNPKARFPKILKKGTELRDIVDSSDEELHKLFLDVFIIENVPDNKVLFRIKGYYCNFLEFIAGQVFFYENHDAVTKKFYLRGGKANYYLRVIIGWLFSWRKASTWFNKVDDAVQYNKVTKRVNIATGRKHYLGEVFNRDQFFPAVYHSFEGYKVPIFKDYQTYLKNLYGDYMKLPPEEKREKHSYRIVNIPER